jgi:hypothetical protein
LLVTREEAGRTSQTLFESNRFNVVADLQAGVRGYLFSIFHHADFWPYLGQGMTEEIKQWLNLNYFLAHHFFLILAATWWREPDSDCGQPRHESEISPLGS